MTVETIMAVASRSVLAEQKNIILVIAFRHKVLLAFQDYLLHVLPTLCTTLCKIYCLSGYRDMHIYDMYISLQQEVRHFKAAQKANGSSATACKGLIFKRHLQVYTWAGDETEENLLFQYLARDTKRLYPFVDAGGDSLHDAKGQSGEGSPPPAGGDASPEPLQRLPAFP